MKPSEVAVNFIFPHTYEVRLQGSYSQAYSAEKLHQFPAQLEEGDRTGLYVRVAPKSGAAWVGFFALGFDSEQVASAIYSSPDPDWLCVLSGGYVYMVDTIDPQRWTRIEQRPVVEVRPLLELNLLLFMGFTSISGWSGPDRSWITERLSWEGLSISQIQGQILRGAGWDAVADKEAPFEVDLLTGQSKGGARPR